MISLTYYFDAAFLTSPALAMLGLSFSPIKLGLLIGWVYLCLYSVQYLQYNPLVPKNYKPLANVGALFLGPVLLSILLIAAAAKKSAQTRQSIFEIIKEQVENLAESIKSSGLIKPKEDDTGLRLLDTSGRSIKEIYGHGKGKRQDNQILDLTEQIIWDALEQRASDILIDPKDNSSYSIRFRVDGVLRTVDQVDTNVCQAIINSIKAVSNMDISERRRPQDGSFTAKAPDTKASFRVASAGVLNGEKLSIRVLNQNVGMYSMDNIGLSEKQRAVIKTEISKPSGMILMCGPTGSGKTTTLYAMLNEIDLYTRNVITVEDPIECVLTNASQIEVNPKADITFGKALRSILRQDPDVICVGEIRDEETASIALRAAQTGHLVLATIHSNSNASALVRLLDLGVPPVLMASGLSLVISQRLLRTLCKKCRVPAKLSPAQINDFRKQNVNYRNMFDAGGCDTCHQTGYYGRTAIYDILQLDDNIKANVAKNELLITQLRKEGDQKGKSNLQKQGLKQVVQGITSIEELKRVLG